MVVLILARRLMFTMHQGEGQYYQYDGIIIVILMVYS